MTSGPPGSKYFGTETAPQPRCFQTTPLRGGVESKVPFHARNKKAVAIGTHATWEARHRGGADAVQSTCDDTGGPRSIDQPLNSASFHSVEGMHNVALVEHGEQALDSVHRVVLARCDIFPQDATCFLHRAQYCFLIGRVQTELLAQQNRELKRRPADSFQSTASRLTRARARGLKSLCSAGAVAFRKHSR